MIMTPPSSIKFILIFIIYNIIRLTRAPQIPEPRWLRPFRTPDWIWEHRLWDLRPTGRLAKTCGPPEIREDRHRHPSLVQPWVRMWARRTDGRKRTAGSTGAVLRIRKVIEQDRWRRPSGWKIRRPPIYMYMQKTI